MENIKQHLTIKNKLALFYLSRVQKKEEKNYEKLARIIANDIETQFYAFNNICTDKKHFSYAHHTHYINTYCFF